MTDHFTKALALGVLASILSFSQSASALDTASYTAIREVKAWSTKIDVYFEGGIEHACGGGEKTRFMLDVNSVNAEQKYDLLMAAFLSGRAVSLNYTCGNDGFPYISGVRTRN
jgi:hypothetical protein